ncbi:MAG: YcaQ family DNA glycosylase [Dehalococcoidia bacterium]|nr:YcaQ family DNA glycosylase [Dehalococcoidia bacterium]
MARTDFSVAEARRIALAAQGFDRARPAGRIDARHLRRVLDTVGLVQIDSVNVLARAHYMPFFSRLGAYDPAQLDRLAWNSGRMFEYWGHEASLIPVERYGLFRHRMEGRRRMWWRRDELIKRRSEEAEALIDHIRTEGPVVHGDVHQGERRPGWWGWSETKQLLEALFTTGRLAVGDRRGFARLYDLPERVIPEAELVGPHPTEEDALRELVRLGAVHHGIGTAADIGDYYRVGTTPAKRALEELADAGEVQRVRVEGWRDPAYLAVGAKLPRRVDARAVLSPFDPVVWFRDRSERLFDFHYRIEIYTPEHKRQYGYYVLPFLLGDRIVGRVDLKADRKASALLVQASHVEPGQDEAEVAAALAAELTEVAGWQGLERIEVRSRGNLARALRQEVR